MARSHIRRASDDKLERLQQLVDDLAATRTDDETIGGLSGDDAAQELAGFIEEARLLSDARPALEPIVVAPPDGRTAAEQRQAFVDNIERLRASDRRKYLKAIAVVTAVVTGAPIDAEAPDDTVEQDHYPFKTAPIDAVCEPCNGTGEVIEYPPDDDERAVTCPGCGGTGERTI